MSYCVNNSAHPNWFRVVYASNLCASCFSAKEYKFFDAIKHVNPEIISNWLASAGIEVKPYTQEQADEDVKNLHFMIDRYS